MLKIKFIFLSLAMAGFFVWPSFCLAETKAESPALGAQLWINEIAWMGTEVSSNDEWLELYNNSATDIDLTGWTLMAIDGTPSILLSGTIKSSDYFLLERTDDSSVPDIAAEQIYTGALGNAGEVLQLKDKEGNVIFMVDASAGWPAGNNSTKQTMSWDGSGWKNSTTSGGTPKAENDFATDQELDSEDAKPSSPPADEKQVSPAPTETTPETQTAYKPGDIVINEFVSDPSDEDVEWVELYNKTTATINVDDWWIEEGSESKTKLAGTILGRDFLVIEKPKGNLNNKGDIIILYDAAGEVIDQVTYGNWQDEDLADNAPVTPDPNSVARVTDGYDTGNDGVDFKITTLPTKGEANIIVAETEGRPPEPPRQNYPRSLIINEVFPNPAGSDTEGEFIEIKNIGNSSVNLDGWKLGDASTRRFTLKDLQIEAGGILAFLRSQTKIALNNSGKESVAIYNPNQEIVNEISYSGKVPEGQSYSRDENGDWFWSSTVTPGEENEIIKENEAPVADIFAVATSTPGEIIIFEGSDSVDPEGGELEYLWDFGDGRTDEGEIVRQIYTGEGEYTVTLKVVDAENASSTATHIITIETTSSTSETTSSTSETTSSTSAGQPKLPPPEEAQFDVEAYGNTPLKYQIFISEFLPNPKGSDVEGEFIELFNPNELAIDLSGWTLDDKEGGSAPYVFPDGSSIDAFQYLLLPRSETEIALNNNGDEVRLIDARGNIVDTAVYEKSTEGVSIIKDELGFLQNTKTVTPGEINVLTVTAPATGVVEATIKDLAEEELNTPVAVKGGVLVPPGVLGNQIFYIGGSQAIQVYMYKKDWPALAVGDEVEIFGTLTQSQGERRIKIKNKDDIRKLNSRKEITSVTLTTNEIDQIEAGLVTAEGEVTESRGYGFYIDDGLGEVYAYIRKPTGIKKDFRVGDQVRVTGILTRNENGYRILPRFPEDILVQKVLAAEWEAEGLAQAAATAQNPVNKYLIATIIALVIMNLGLVWKLKKQA